MNLPKVGRLNWAFICCLAVALRCWIMGDSATMTVAGLLAFIISGVQERLDRIEASLEARQAASLLPSRQQQDASVN